MVDKKINQPVLNWMGCKFKGQVIMDKVAVLIDGGYFSKVLKYEFDEPSLDFSTFVSELVGEDIILRTYYYTCDPWQSNPPTEEEKSRFSNTQRFHAVLRHLNNFEVRCGRLAHRGIDKDGNPIFEQKGVDVLLTIDMLGLSIKPSVTKIYIVSNDSDFVPAIQFVKNQGVQVVLVHGKEYQNNLGEVADQKIKISKELINKSKLKKH